MNLTTQDLCPRCARIIEADDAFCRHCGRKLGDASWYHTKVFVLTSALLFLGPFCFPLLWRSHEFSRTEKVIWTLVISGIAMVAVIIPVMMILRGVDTLKLGY